MGMPGQGGAGQDRTGPGWAGQGRTKPSRANQSRAEQSRTGQNGTGQNGTGQHGAGNRVEQSKTEQSRAQGWTGLGGGHRKADFWLQKETIAFACDVFLYTCQGSGLLMKTIDRKSVLPLQIPHRRYTVIQHRTGRLFCEQWFVTWGETVVLHLSAELHSIPTAE